MVDRNIINNLGISPEELDDQVGQLFGQEESDLLLGALDKKVAALTPGTILKGRILQQIGNDVILEIGLKSEGVVEASEFDDPSEIEAGREIEVLLEDIDVGGLIILSKRKADRIRGWEKIIETNAEGDVVTGKVVRRIKGGLLVDIGVPVFLPASQVDIRKPGDISRFIGRDVTCEILKIDTENRNIVVSRRKVIEEERSVSKEKLLSEIELNQVRKGVVKNIADFGVFVDLGGLDGLLHISDLSWGRITHPSEVVHLDQEIECVVIGLDKENEKVSLGLKQKNPSPWENIESYYTIGAKVKGKVVNVMNYGVFVRLQEGVEGLVHISEMSWTKRISHPADLFNLNDEVEVVVLDVNKEKQEISLGIKQLEANPWAVASQKYPPGTIVTVRATSLTNYGVFVEIEPGIDGLIHISDMSWTKKFNHPSEIVQKGQEVKCVVLEVDENKQRISLGIKQLSEDPWLHAIPDKYMPGQVVKGTITKLTNFGVFVELEGNLEGLLHISEIADHKIDAPQDIVNPGDEVEVKILRVDSEARKIGLSMRRVQWAAEDEKQKHPDADTDAVSEEAPRRGGLDGSLLIPTAEIAADAPKESPAAAEPEEVKPAEPKEEVKPAEPAAAESEPAVTAAESEVAEPVAQEEQQSDPAPETETEPEPETESEKE